MRYSYIYLSFIEEVMVNGTLWDVYDIAAARDGYLNFPSASAIICMLIQICVPIYMAARAHYADNGSVLNSIV
jgi:hypothetical protein